MKKNRDCVDYTKFKKGEGFRKCKILFTIGPTCCIEEKIWDIIDAGANSSRLNFSHGDQDGQLRCINLVTYGRGLKNRNVAIVQDLQGPKIRVGKIEGRSLDVYNGDRLLITTEKGFIGNSMEDKIGCTYESLAKDCEEGQIIYIDDGRVKLRVIKIMSDTLLSCAVLVGGNIREHKGMNTPGMKTSASCLTEKDKTDLKFGLIMQVDYVCLSFVNSAEDIILCRSLMEDKSFNSSGYTCPIIAKIETQSGLDNISSISSACAKYHGGVMVARGDLAMETSFSTLCAYQKTILRACVQTGCAVAITATELLQSMTRNVTPTRAEVCDVGHAVYDGTGVTMLSQETAYGNNPVRSVAMMAKILANCEKFYYKLQAFRPTLPDAHEEEVGNPLVEKFILAELQKTRVVFVASESGALPGKLSALLRKHGSLTRHFEAIVLFTAQEKVHRRMALVWGVVSKVVEKPITDLKQLTKFAKSEGLDAMNEGDKFLAFVDGEKIQFSAQVF